MGGLVDRTGSVFFIPSFEPPLVYDRFAEARKPFCSIFARFLTPHFSTIYSLAHMYLSLSMRIQKNFKKIFKISSQHPISGAFGRFLDTFGYLQEPRERLFSLPPFLQIFYKLLRNFVSKMPASVPQEFQKPTFTSLIHPSYAHRSGQKNSTISPKNFQYFLQRLYKVHTEALPGVQKRKRVHGEFCSESCGKFCGESCDGLRGASSVNLAAHPFSKTRLNLQATHKILPRKATTGQNARRCKYSLLGIQ